MAILEVGDCHYVSGLAPVADAFSGTVYSDVVNMKNFHQAKFIVWKAVGTTGTSTLTVEACDDASASNVSAIAFRYQKQSSSDDTFGALTAATSSGFATTAGSNQIYLIYVDAADMAASGYQYLRLKAVEVANDPVLGGILIELSGARNKQPIQDSAIV